MSTEESRSLQEKAARISLLVLDVDGVLTDGRVVYGDSGVELKHFHVRDGSGLKFWQSAGNRVAIISGRSSTVVERRAKELGIAPVFQGIDDKRVAFQTILQQTGLTEDAVCAMGDDLPDLPVLSACGLRVAVADACSEVQEIADFITLASGGHGAVREAIEWLLKLQGRWDEVVQRYRQAV